MRRRSTGQVLERQTKGGIVFALRFRAYGERQYVTLGSRTEGWTRAKAGDKLRHILADVEREVWVSPAQEQEAEDRAERDRQDDPLFAEYATEWVARREVEWAPRTRQAYGFEVARLVAHFGELRMSTIGPRDVDRFKAVMLRRGASPAYTNKMLARLAAIFAEAVDYGLTASNPAVGKGRRAKAPKPSPVWLDKPEMAVALLEAAGQLDAETVAHGREDRQHVRKRPVLAVMLLGGLRVGEVCGLRWRDVDLAHGRLRVAASKTDAGRRWVDMVPVLRDELAAFKALRSPVDPDAAVFPTGKGRARTKDNIRQRFLIPAIKRANALLAKDDHLPLPHRLTSHGLRHTFTSALCEVGESPVYVASQIGHTDPAFTLRIYAHVMSRRDGDKAAWMRLLGRDDAVSGTGLGTKPADTAKTRLQ